jgi:hypothetical protein
VGKVTTPASQQPLAIAQTHPPTHPITRSPNIMADLAEKNALISYLISHIYRNTSHLPNASPILI